MTQRLRLLVNWIYYPPIGHAIEGLCHAHRFLSGSPDLEIGVLLPSSTGTELGQCLPDGIRVYPIDLALFEREQGHKGQGAGDPFAAFEHVPREWDCLFNDVRLLCPTGSQVLDRCQVALRKYIHAGLANRGWDDAGFPSSKLCPMVFRLPQPAKDFAAKFFAGSTARPRICLLLGSSSDAGRTPPLTFWHVLIASLTTHIPGVEFVLLGALAPGRTRTRSVTHEAISELESRHPNLRNAFDKGLLNQLALAQASDLCISPHSGMTFAVQCVGTPCLYLSGHCAEYWLNGVPSVSVFPECDRYPCHWPHPQKPASHEILAECIAREKAGRPFLCQDRPALSDKIPEIVATAQRLMAGELGFHDCLRAHQRLLCKRGVCGPDEWPYDGGAGLLAPEFVFPRNH